MLTSVGHSGLVDSVRSAVVPRHLSHVLASTSAPTWGAPWRPGSVRRRPSALQRAGRSDAAPSESSLAPAACRARETVLAGQRALARPEALPCPSKRAYVKPALHSRPLAEERVRTVYLSPPEPSSDATKIILPAVPQHPPPPPCTEEVLIEFRNVHKSFGSRQVLRGASFCLRRGEAVGIIGASGTGKSTALRIAAGLVQPDEGQVLIRSVPRRGLLSDATAAPSASPSPPPLHVGLVFQSGALFDSLSVAENVGFTLLERGATSPRRLRKLVAAALARVGLPGSERLMPAQLSGGMRKRVALARAIVRSAAGAAEDQVLLYDEPTAGLDPVASTVVEDLIRSLHVQDDPRGVRGEFNQGELGGGGEAVMSESDDGSGGSVGGIRSYLVVTHQQSTIRRAVDRIIFLHQGKVVWEGSVPEMDTTDEKIVRQFASGSLDGPIAYM